ncbi:MAG TPA: hypothetical protein VKT32_06460 [Chthonomonadaceae bacterium]|nr:hypothetical protein [Chthonomonadaceae bacterium]
MFLTRREFLRMAGVGGLAGLLPRSLRAAVRPQVPEARSSPVGPIPDLRQVATRTPIVNDDRDGTYFWMDGSTVLFLRLTPNTTLYHATFIDAATGRKTLPEAFNTRNGSLLRGQSMIVMAGNHREQCYLPLEAVLSPDKRWLLWSSLGTLSGPRWVAATLSGAEQRQWKPDSDPASQVAGLPGHALWMRDSRMWVELVYRYANRNYTITRANVYELDDSSPIRKIAVQGLEDGLLAGLTGDNEILMYYPPDPIGRHETPITEAHFSLVPLTSATVTARDLTITIPTSMDIASVLLSPQGDRLAWILQRGGLDSPVYTLYVSDGEGKGMRAIGSAPYVQVGKRYSWPGDLRWLPDGKRVSFVYRNALYTVPI